MSQLVQTLLTNMQQEFAQNPIEVSAAVIATIALIGGGIFALVQRARVPHQAEPSVLAIQRFEKIWPQLSESLHEDVAKSRASAIEAIRSSENDTLSHLRHFPNRTLYDQHWAEIVAYEPELAKTLQRYAPLTVTLNHKKHVYDDLHYKTEHDRDAIEQAKSEMTKAAHELADLIDLELEPQIKRQDSLVLKQPE